MMRKPCKAFYDRRCSEMIINSVNIDSADVATADVDSIVQLRNVNIVNYVLSRALHLNDVCSAIESKCTNRDFDIFDFPFMDMERIGRVLHAESSRDDVSLQFDMNKECLEKNLLSFGLQCDAVAGNGCCAGNGNCCFTSIAMELHKLVLQQGNDAGNRIVQHLHCIGLSKGIASDTIRLRQLFCEEIQENKKKYKSWVDNDIEKEIENFSNGGWFNGALGDLCVIACSNVLKTTIMVVTSMARVPCIPFVPDAILTDGVLYIAFNHPYPGHYDATKGL